MAEPAKRRPMRNRGPRPPAAPTPPTAPEGAMYAADYEAGDSLDIPIEEIVPHPRNKRDRGDLTSLKKTIAKYGLLQPVAVYERGLFLQHYPDLAEHLPEQGKFVLGFGERRWRAWAELYEADPVKFAKIPAIVRHDVIETSVATLIIENFHRKNLNPIEEAVMFSLLKDEGKSYAEIAEETGVPKTDVTRGFALLALAPELRDEVAAGRIKPRTALEFKDMSDEQQAHAAKLLLAGVPRAKVLDDVVAWDGEEAPAAAAWVDEAGAEPVGSIAAEIASDASAATSDDPVTATPPEGSGALEVTQVPESAASPSTAPAPAPASKAARSSNAAIPVDRVTGQQRQEAQLARQAACIDLLKRDLEPAVKAGVIAECLFVPFQLPAAQARAYAWLREAGVEQIEMSSSSAYFEAVFAQSDPNLIQLVAFATALAAGELRASDRRRPTWDALDRRYVKRLIDISGYVPSTAWERKQLDLPELDPAS